jgi:prophage antirepressor-like protein
MTTNTVINLIRELFENEQMRIVNSENILWFCATDLAKILGYTEGRNCTRFKDVDINTRKFKIEKTRPALFVNEHDLYEIIIRSNKPNAKKFKDWVKQTIHEIRTKGYYIDDEPLREKFEADNKEDLVELKERYAKEMNDLTEKLKVSHAQYDKMYAVIDDLDNALNEAFDEDAMDYENVAGICSKHQKRFKIIYNASDKPKKLDPTCDPKLAWQASIAEDNKRYMMALGWIKS